MSEENWYVADEREDYDFTITSGYDTICGNIGGNTIGEQIDLANRIAKLPQLECELAEAREQRDGLAAIARELTAMIRVNVMWGRFAECSVEQIDEHLKPWNEKIAAVEGGKP